MKHFISLFSAVAADGDAVRRAECFFSEMQRETFKVFL
jgi:hypothetical protein